MVGTAGQGDKFVPEFRCDTSIVQRFLFYIVVPVIKFFLSISLKELVVLKHIIVLIMNPRIKGGYQLIFPFFVESIKVNDVVGKTVFFIPVQIKIAKHFPRFGHMTMNNKVCGWFCAVGLTLLFCAVTRVGIVVQHQTAVDVICPVEIVLKVVIFVLKALHYGIVYKCVIYL